MLKQRCSRLEVLSAAIGGCGNAPSGLPWELETLFKTKYRKAMQLAEDASVNIRMVQGNHRSVTNFFPVLNLQVATQVIFHKLFSIYSHLSLICFDPVSPPTTPPHSHSPPSRMVALHRECRAIYRLRLVGKGAERDKNREGGKLADVYVHYICSNRPPKWTSGISHDQRWHTIKRKRHLRGDLSQ